MKDFNLFNFNDATITLPNDSSPVYVSLQDDALLYSDLKGPGKGGDSFPPIGDAPANDGHDIAPPQENPHSEKGPALPPEPTPHADTIDPVPEHSDGDIWG